ncbi:MAG: SDR family NAD(P)-dependent oxidoreductase, partial [Clostridia bacterium]|nr:SDR family NAD(P)-dependent oxidoreductase [Clostridia bacterium]
MNSKTAIVTGGASGIGRASALAFAKNGANVFIIDIDADGANAVVEEIAMMGGKTVAYKADITKESEVKKAVERCVELFGDIDYAHNNAGIVL